MSLLTLLLLTAPRARPDRVAATLDEATSTEVRDLVVFEDFDVAAIIDGSGDLRVIDTDTWQVDIVSLCGATALTGYVDAASDTLVLLAGCTTGEVQEVVIDAYHDLSVQDAVGLGLGAVLDLAVDAAGDLWVAVDGVNVHPFDAATLVADDGRVATLTLSNFKGLAPIGNFVLAVHGGDDISRIDISTGNAALTTENIGNRSFDDVATWGTTGVYLADSSQGALVQYNLAGGTNNDYQILLDDEDGLTGLSALTVGGQDASDAWMAVADAGLAELLFFEFDTTNLLVGDTLLDAIDVSAWGGGADLEAMDGYLLAASKEGHLLVLTDRPWVSVSSNATGVVAEGDVVDLSFSADMGGDWSVRLGGLDGDELASGTLSADEVVELPVTVDEAWVEGRNRLVVRVERGDLVGRGGLAITADNPPPAVGGLALSAGRQKLLLEFDGIDDADLDHYDIYISTVAFTAAAWPEGGPAFEGEDAVSSPITLSGYSPGEAISTSIEGLTNDVTYYVAVRATDTNGTEGNMSEVLSAAPVDATGAAGLAGDAGGLGCGARAGAPLALLGLLAGLMAASRRGLPLAALALALAPGLARAEDDGRVKGHRDDDGKIVIDRTGELRVGGTTLTDPAITSVYGDRGLTSLDLEMGMQLFRVLEFDAGLGLVRDTGAMVAVDTGAATGEDAKLSLVPMSLQATLRLDPFDGMPLVPYASAGLDYWLWRERLGAVDVSELLDQDAVMGSKRGYHTALGVNVLLDWADPKHASLARARWGIHDTYFTIEAGWNRMFAEEGLSFDSRAITAGLKFDH